MTCAVGGGAGYAVEILTGPAFDAHTVFGAPRDACRCDHADPFADDAPFDPAPWLSDLDELRSAFADKYANLIASLIPTTSPFLTSVGMCRVLRYIALKYPEQPLT